MKGQYLNGVEIGIHEINSLDGAIKYMVNMDS